VGATTGSAGAAVLAAGCGCAEGFAGALFCLAGMGAVAWAGPGREDGEAFADAAPAVPFGAG